MKRVLILDANQRSALAVTRSLGHQGIELITADETKSALAGQSTYSQKYCLYPSPQSHPMQFCDEIRTLCKNENIDIIMPMTELTSLLLLDIQSTLPSVTLPFADSETVDMLSDKYKLMPLAASLNIPVPKTWYIDDIDNMGISLADMSYPLILKPGKSWLQHEDNWYHTTVRIAQDVLEAQNILATDIAYKKHPFMLQEYIPGKGAGIFAIYNHGTPTAFFAHKRLREKPPQGGVSVLSESAPVDDTLKSYAQKLLEHVDWHGVAMVEFRISDEGKPYLMEINTRFWGSLQLAIDAGVDFPWLLYNSCLKFQQGNQTFTQPVITKYKTGCRLRWLLGDVDALYLTLRDKTYSLKNKLFAVMKFLVPRPMITRHEVNRFNDLKPFFWELKQYIKDLAR